MNATTRPKTLDEATESAAARTIASTLDTPHAPSLRVNLRRRAF